MPVGVDETIIGAEGSQEEAVPGVEGSDAASVGGYESGGEKFTAEQMQEAIEAWRDRDAWEASFKQRDQRHAAVRGAIESGFGKKMTDFDEADLRDLKAFGLINEKLRAEPQFAKAWEESLVAAYKQAGLSTTEAKKAADADVAKAEAGGPAKLPEEVMSRLKRVDDFESMIVQQGLTQFEGVLEKEIAEVIGKYAADLGQFSPMLRNMVLQGISGYTNVELLEKHQSGELKRELNGLARGSTKTVRDYLGQKAGAAGAAVDKGKLNAAPGPARGGAAEKVEVVEPKGGSGMSQQTKRFLRDMGDRNA